MNSIAECTREGLAAARKRARTGVRPQALSEEAKIEIRRMRDQDLRTMAN